MSGNRGSKSIWKKFKKPEAEAKREESDRLYYRINRKTGRIETNLLEWERSWRNVKILKFPARYADELRAGVRVNYTVEQILAENVMLPEVDTTREFWTPTPEEAAELEAIAARPAREARKTQLFKAWREQRQEENARRKALNEVAKTRIDLEVKDLKERKDNIGKIMGEVLEDMTKTSRDRVEKYVKVIEEGDENEGLATTLDEARELGDWLFIFEAARETHMFQGAAEDRVLMFEKQEQEKDYLAKLKHVSGDFNRWITKFEDQIETCETIGVDLSEEAKMFYFMSNLNDSIFGDVKANYMDLSTRALFPNTYEEIKQRIIAEYSQITSRRPQTVLKVIRGEDSRRYGEASFKAEEEGCHICGVPGHFYRSCKFYNRKYSLEQNRDYYQKKHKSQADGSRSSDGSGERQGNTGNAGHRGSRATRRSAGVTSSSPSVLSTETQPEQARLSRELNMDQFHTAHLSAEELSLVCRCGTPTIDLLLDTGTVSNLVPQDSRDVVHDLRNEAATLLGVGGARVMATETGEAGVFGKSRIVPGSGAICISQLQFGNRFQMLNPHKDLVILRGWPSTPYANREYHFTRDEQDQLLHCKLKSTSEMAMLARGASFYQPDELPDELPEQGQRLNLNKLNEIRRFHEYYSHPSLNEMKRMVEKWSWATTITRADIEAWHSTEGKFCVGCLEGKLKEHARKASTKPLAATRPGENGVADLMFIEGKSDFRTPFYIHVDVATKLIIGYPLKNKTYGEVLRAIEHVDEQHRLTGKKLERLTFDRESSIVVMQEDIESRGIRLTLKAAGQKVGLAEVSIRLIREKARATKAGVRAMYGYMPANQFNVDLCVDTISVLNRTMRVGQHSTPFEIFSGEQIDYVRDFRCRWGELVIVKKPKGIASDLRATGEWAMVVRRMMNGTGVIKVYLIGSKKYAYRLKFKRAVPPEWVIIAMNSIGDRNIGFEEESEIEGAELLPDVVEVGQDIGLEENIDINQENEPANLEEGHIDELDEAIRVLENADTYDEDEDEITPDHPVTRSAINHDRFQAEQEAERYAEYVAMGWREPEAQDLGKVVFNRNFRRTERNLAQAKETLRKSYLSRHGDEIVQEESANIYFDQALKTKPKEAWDALLKEVLKGDSKRIWHGELIENLTPEERKLVLPMMKNYIEKYSPSGEFEKSKVRVLVRGDLQNVIGETQGPVCRIESIFILISIAAYYDLEVFKIDITSAFLNTPMNEDVKHKWLMLDKDVASVLLSMDNEYWRPFLRRDGKILVKLDKIMYGFKEAAYWWNVMLTKVFLDGGYQQMAKDKCVLVKRDSGKVSYCAITVDDCFFVTTRDEEWIKGVTTMLEDAFEELTLERGDKINILGMTVQMDRNAKRAIVNQKRFVDKLAETYKITKTAVTPANADLLYEREDSKLLDDQRKFMSLNASLMYASKRTYPEVSFPVVYLASRYNKATEDDYGKAIRVAEYIVGCGQEHCLILAPKSLQLVARSDASYAEHKDGKSHTGGCVGFESDTACWFMWVSSKQPVVALSSCESELIATSTVGGGVAWGTQFLQELGHDQSTIIIGVDNKCSMHLLEQGTGSFKRAKHIKVRYFWLKDLIDEEEIELQYIPSEELVADLLTKAITGAKFKYLRGKLLGAPQAGEA